jgi:predicted Zn-dependent protease
MSLMRRDGGRWGARGHRLGAGLVVVSLLGGCAGDLLFVGPETTAPTVELPSDAPKVSGAETLAQQQHLRMVQAFGGEYRAPAVQEMLASLLLQLRNATDSPGQTYRVTILNSGLVNAFALPNGQLYVTRGLLLLANDQAEVASVLAHEIAHVTARHAIERQELESRSVLVSRVRAEVLNNPGAAQLVRDQAQVAIASFSRQQELEADRLGVQTLAAGGFDPYGAHRFLHALGRNAELQDRASEARARTEGLDFTTTHPTTPDRIQQALLAARQHGTPGLVPVERNRWLQALTGVIYGEDSNEGFVRGRTFLHPRLGISFVAPEGFFLENAPQAVLGMTPGATEALRFDSAKVPAGVTLEKFLEDNRIEGLPLSEVRTIAFNGLEGATGLARGSDWTFRIAAIRVGGQVYRLILAARNFTAETDQRFLAAIESFRRLSSAEQARARPLRIAIHTARRGETAEDLSARMGGVDRPLERFYIINGLEPGAALEPGRTYKTIID